MFVCRRCVVGASLRLPYFRFAPIARFQRTSREIGGDAGDEAAPSTGTLPRIRGARRAKPALVVLRGAAMPRLFDSACHDQIFIAASASRDRFAPFGLAFGEVSLASLGAFPLAFRDGFRVS